LVSLTNASAGALADDEASWPEQIDLDGFRYERLYSNARGWRQRARWLRRQGLPSPQGYIQLASVYRACGDDRDARKILVERHNALLHPPEYWKPELPTGWRGFAGRVWRQFLRFTIGHGYEPWRVLWLAVPLVVAMSLWYAAGARNDLLIPTREAEAVSSHCSHGYTCLQPVVYTLDTLLPIIDLGQRARWTPDQSRHNATWYYDGRWLAAGTWFMSSLGWILATLVAASFTQAIRRE
jgi:hypothetical protein